VITSEFVRDLIHEQSMLEARSVTKIDLVVLEKSNRVAAGWPGLGCSPPLNPGQAMRSGPFR